MVRTKDRVWLASFDESSRILSGAAFFKQYEVRKSSGGFHCPNIFFLFSMTFYHRKRENHAYH